MLYTWKYHFPNVMLIDFIAYSLFCGIHPGGYISLILFLINSLLIEFTNLNMCCRVYQRQLHLLDMQMTWLSLDKPMVIVYKHGCT